MDKDLEKLEARSKKVRDTMADKPPFFIRYGTTIIATSLLVITIVLLSILY